MTMRRKTLEAMGLEEEKIQSIIDMHTETVDSLKEKLKAAEEKAEKLEAVQKELNELKASNHEDYKKKYEDEHQAFESYKKEVAAKETKAAKEAAVKSFFEGKNIVGANLAIAMRGAKDEIAGIELDDGKIKDTTSLEKLVEGEYAGLVVKKSSQGANTSTPPGNNGGKMTREEIMKIKDDGERQKAIMANPGEFGLRGR